MTVNLVLCLGENCKRECVIPNPSVCGWCAHSDAPISTATMRVLGNNLGCICDVEIGDSEIALVVLRTLSG